MDVGDNNDKTVTNTNRLQNPTPTSVWPKKWVENFEIEIFILLTRLRYENLSPLFLLSTCQTSILPRLNSEKLKNWHFYTFKPKLTFLRRKIIKIITRVNSRIWRSHPMFGFRYWGGIQPCIAVFLFPSSTDRGSRKQNVKWGHRMTKNF